MTDTVKRNIDAVLAKFAPEHEAERSSKIIKFAAREPEVNFNNPLGYFHFTGMFNGMELGMELYDYARCYELWTPGDEGEMVAYGDADDLPPEFTPEMRDAICTFEQWITNTEARK